MIFMPIYESADDMSLFLGYISITDGNKVLGYNGLMKMKICEKK